MDDEGREKVRNFLIGVGAAVLLLSLLFMNSLPAGAVKRSSFNADQIGLRLAATPGVNTGELGEFLISPGTHALTNYRVQGVCYTFEGISPTVTRLRNRHTGDVMTKADWDKTGLSGYTDSDQIEYLFVATTKVFRHPC